MEKTVWRKKAAWPKIAVGIICVMASIAYIIYRCLFTLPLGLRFVDIIFGIIVFIVELIELIEFIVYFWNNMRFKKTSPTTPEAKIKKLGDVDVFVATLNEDTRVLRKTLLACKKMKYPGSVKIYLCDDGERDEMAALAEELEVNYLARERHDFAKAGNYNYALKHSSSPYIAVFDADMRPRKNFLLKTMPFFAKEEKLGFVQTPQCFKNADIFQSRFSTKMPCEQDYFYKYIQLARNNSNSTILCGTNCVILREALKSVGGFACATIAEDVATGMLMEAKGYRGLAITDVLAKGEAIDDYWAFLKQRSRWGRGCVQTAKSYGIFSVKGLKLRQKFDYLVAINYWCFGLKRLFFMALPLLFIFFGVIAIEGNLKVFIPLFLAQYCLKRFVIDWVEQSGRSATWAKIYELIQAPFLAWEVLRELLGLSSKKFLVTPKGEKGGKTVAEYWMTIVHWALFLVNSLGLAYGIFRVQNEGLSLYLIPLIWIAINTLYLAIVLIFDLRHSRKVKILDEDRRKKYGPRAFASIIWREK